ncbi:MAG: hypothetical protein PHS37_05980, partial [Candidatus Omnitrophica bacterium]|nr:hypothetical protein [Candidatus Omnitrophota bacterium]
NFYTKVIRSREYRRSQEHALKKLAKSLDDIQLKFRKLVEGTAPDQFGMTGHGWNELLSINIFAPYLDNTDNLRRPVENIHVIQYIEYCKRWIEYALKSDDAYVFGRGLEPTYGFDARRRYAPVLYLKAPHFTQLRDTQNRMVQLMPGYSEDYGTRPDHAGNPVSCYHPAEDNALFNGPAEYGPSFHPFPITHLSDSLLELARRIKEVQEIAEQAAPSRQTERLSREDMAEAITVSNAQTYFVNRQSIRAHAGLFGPGPSRSSDKKGVFRHGISMIIIAAAIPLLIRAAYRFRSALITCGIIGADPNFTLLEFAFFSLIMMSTSVVLYATFQKLILSEARYIGADETAEDVRQITRFVPKNILYESIKDVTRAIYREEGSEEYIPACLLPVDPAGDPVNLTPDNAPAMLQELRDDYENKFRLYASLGRVPSQHPFYRLLLKYPILHSLYLSCVERSRLIEIILADTRLATKLDAAGFDLRAHPEYPLDDPILSPAGRAYSNYDILSELNCDDILYIISHYPQLFPKVNLMLTIFGAYRGSVLSKMIRIVNNFGDSYPGLVERTPGTISPIEITPCVDSEDDNTRLDTYEAIYGSAASGQATTKPGPLNAYRDTIFVAGFPRRGMPYGRGERIDRKKPALNAWSVWKLTWRNARENKKASDYVELIDEEDIVTPLDLIAKACVMEMRQRAIREQLNNSYRRHPTDEPCANTDDTRQWGINIDRQRPALEKEFDTRVYGLMKDIDLPGVLEDANLWHADNRKGTGRNLLDDIKNGFNIREALESLIEMQVFDRARLNEIKNEITDIKHRLSKANDRLEKARLGKILAGETLKLGECYANALSHDKNMWGAYLVYAFLRPYIIDIRSDERRYPGLSDYDAAKRVFVETEFKVRNIPDVIQSELRHITMDMPNWSRDAFVDYFVWHNLVQVGQTKVGFLFLGGTGNNFVWENLAGIEAAFDPARQAALKSAIDRIKKRLSAVKAILKKNPMHERYKKEYRSLIAHLRAHEQKLKELYMPYIAPYSCRAEIMLWSFPLRRAVQEEETGHANTVRGEFQDASLIRPYYHTGKAILYISVLSIMYLIAHAALPSAVPATGAVTGIALLFSIPAIWNIIIGIGIYFLKVPPVPESVRITSKTFRKYINDLELVGVWDMYNQIEDAERGSRIALKKLKCTRLTGKYVQILEELLPALGHGWHVQRERWIIFQAFWVILAYPPAFFMYLGQFIGFGVAITAFFTLTNGTGALATLGIASLGFFGGGIIAAVAGLYLVRPILKACGVSINPSTSRTTFMIAGQAGGLVIGIATTYLLLGMQGLTLLAAGTAGFVLGGLGFYGLGYLVYKVFSGRGIVRGEQFDADPMTALGGFGIAGWLKGFWLLQNVATLSGATLILFLSGVMIRLTIGTGILYLILRPSIMGMNVTGMLITVLLSYKIYRVIMDIVNKRLALQAAVKVRGEFVKVGITLINSIVTITITCAAYFLFQGFTNTFFVDTLGYGSGTGTVLFDLASRIMDLLRQANAFFMDWRWGLGMYITQPILLLCMAAFALWRYAPENEESTNQAVNYMMADEEFSYLYGLREFVKTKVPDPATGGMRTVLSQILGDSAHPDHEDLAAEDVKDYNTVDAILDTYKKELLIDLEKVARDPAYQMHTELIGFKGVVKEYLKSEQGALDFKNYADRLSKDPMSEDTTLSDFIVKEIGTNPSLNAEFRELYLIAVPHIERALEGVRSVSRGEYVPTWKLAVTGAILFGAGIVMMYASRSITISLVPMIGAVILAGLGTLLVAIYSTNKLYRAGYISRVLVTFAGGLAATGLTYCYLFWTGAADGFLIGIPFIGALAASLLAYILDTGERKPGHSVYVAGRLTYHMLAYLVLAAIRVTEYFMHMDVPANRSIKRSMMAFEAWWVSEGFWLRGRTDAERILMSRGFDYDYVTASAHNFIHNRTRSVVLLAIPLAVLTLQPIANMIRLSQIKDEFVLLDDARRYHLLYGESRTSVVREAFQSRLKRLPIENMVGYIEGMIHDFEESCRRAIREKSDDEIKHTRLKLLDILIGVEEFKRHYAGDQRMQPAARSWVHYMDNQLQEALSRLGDRYLSALETSLGRPGLSFLNNEKDLAKETIEDDAVSWSRSYTLPKGTIKEGWGFVFEAEFPDELDGSYIRVTGESEDGKKIRGVLYGTNSRRHIPTDTVPISREDNTITDRLKNTGEQKMYRFIPYSVNPDLGYDVTITVSRPGSQLSADTNKPVEIKIGRPRVQAPLPDKVDPQDVVDSIIHATLTKPDRFQKIMGDDASLAKKTGAIAQEAIKAKIAALERERNAALSEIKMIAVRFRADRGKVQSLQSPLM